MQTKQTKRTTFLAGSVGLHFGSLGSCFLLFRNSFMAKTNRTIRTVPLVHNKETLPQWNILVKNLCSEIMQFSRLPVMGCLQAWTLVYIYPVFTGFSDMSWSLWASGHYRKDFTQSGYEWHLQCVWSHWDYHGTNASLCLSDLRSHHFDNVQSQFSLNSKIIHTGAWAELTLWT